MPITPVTTASPEGQHQIAFLLNRFQTGGGGARETVAGILAQVRAQGDQALVEYTRKFDCPSFTADLLKVSAEEIGEARRRCQAMPDLLPALELAAKRIRAFHERGLEQSWITTWEDGTITGRLVHPVDSAGLYVPGGRGGKTPLVSSVLMNGIPAAIAGVERIVMVTPPDEAGQVSPALLVAAEMVGVTEIYKVGSAWAIAALAFGTERIAPVDVVVGPGNQFVTEAKHQVAGRVRIDMIAGPSEVLIVADDTANPAFIAADMLAQAEHDEQALAMLITTSATLAGAVVRELEEQVRQLAREQIARKSLENRGVILIAGDLGEAMALASRIAAEHLELLVQQPFDWVGKIRHAGAIFLGPHSPEATGDYVAGPNHVLPTMGTARFSSSLGVETFLKKSSLISYSEQALHADSAHIQTIANLEGLSGHAQSVAVRVKKTA